MYKPNLFLVGAAKAGTTLLFKELIKDKKFSFGEEKEPHALICENPDLESYYRLFQTESEYIVDASVSYLPNHNTVIKNINKIGKNAKIIAVLRNPFDRAISHYQYYKHLEYETSEVNEAFYDLHRVNNDPWESNFNPYLECSLYYDALVNYAENFDILILKFDDLISANASVEKSIKDFLNADISLQSIQPTNQTLESKVKLLDTIVNPRMRRAIAQKTPQIIKSKLKKVLYKKPSRDNFEFPSEFVGKVNADLKKCEDILDFDIDSWYKN